MVKATGMGDTQACWNNVIFYKGTPIYFVLLTQIHTIQLVVIESDDKFPQEYRVKTGESFALCTNKVHRLHGNPEVENIQLPLERW